MPPILIVDDYQSMIQIIRSLLRQIGFHDVDEARGGAEAYKKMKSRDYALVISDWNMAPVSGIELLQKIRSEQQHAKTPFIMLSADSTVENVMAAKKAGADNMILKPFSAKTLKGKIAAVLSMKKTAAEEPVDPLFV